MREICAGRSEGLEIGQRVGVGWTAGTCMHCEWCIGGDANLCPQSMPTIVGHYSSFAERVGARGSFPIREEVNASDAGPLLCGGVTVFTPLRVFRSEVDRQSRCRRHRRASDTWRWNFANAWGCEVTAFTSTDSKANEARGFGAHRVVNSRNSAEVKNIAGSLDLLIVTVNVPLGWPAMLATLRPKGRLHVVGAVPEPIPVAALDLHSDAAKRLWFAKWRSDYLAKMFDSRRAPQNFAEDRAFPDYPRQRSYRALLGGQGSVPGGPRYVSADNFSLKARFRVRP